MKWSMMRYSNTDPVADDSDTDDDLIHELDVVASSLQLASH
jgi:hypothetical protein